MIKKLSGAELAILEDIFGSQGEKKLSSPKGKFYHYISKIQNELYKEGRSYGYFPKNPNNVSLY